MKKEKERKKERKIKKGVFPRIITTPSKWNPFSE